MDEIPLLKNFYDQAILPIGTKDKLALINQQEDLDNCTHWLIGLLWHDEESSTWKVVVSPISNDKPYWYYYPIYVSEPYRFDDSLVSSKKIQQKLMTDVFISEMFCVEAQEIST